MSHPLVLHYARHMLKHFDDVLSDEQCKDIHDSVDLPELAQNIIEQGPPFTRRQIEVLTKVAGEMDDQHSFERDGHMWRDDILDKYADHIQNYKYNYKEEARQIDPSINPEEEHIGPMAQDIQKADPNLVTADPATGYLEVKIPESVMEHTGLIAELARRVRELEKHV
jgi:hypothetical protein